jgi:outer membrane immunogenic protein
MILASRESRGEFVMPRPIKALCLAIGLTATGACLAAAADMPVKARPAPVAAAYNWTGIYLGAHVGYGWGRKEWTDPAGPPFDAGTHTADGWLGGLQAGANYQIGAWVLGIEGQYSWAKLEGSHAIPFDPVDILETKVHWLATLTGRVGYAFDRTLIYAKGGAAWIKDAYGKVDLGVVEGIASATRTGWIVGGGVEYAFWNAWSVKVEYNYMDFGTGRADLLDPATGVIEPLDVRQTVHTVTLGVNYRFWGPGGLAVRY